MLAILEAIRLWRPYLLGQRFKICTDQRSLRYMLEQRITTPEQQRWIAKLVGFGYEILYKPGRENNAADALSRRGSDGSEVFLNKGATSYLLSSPQWALWDDIRAATVHDCQLGELFRKLQGNPHSVEGCTLRDGCIVKRGKILVPSDPRIRRALLHEFHATAMGGHSGVLRTYRRIAQAFSWEGLRKDVTKYVHECDVCQRNKYDTRTPAGLLQPLSVPEKVWSDVSMDFIDGLPTSTGHDSIMVVVDRLTKYAHFIALSHPYTAKVVAEAFVRGIVRLHGIPESILSDRDKIFISHFWRELFKLQGTGLKMSSAYHPQTDG